MWLLEPDPATRTRAQEPLLVPRFIPIADHLFETLELEPEDAIAWLSGHDPLVAASSLGGRGTAFHSPMYLDDRRVPTTPKRRRLRAGGRRIVLVADLAELARFPGAAFSH